MPPAEPPPAERACSSRGGGNESAATARTAAAALEELACYKAEYGELSGKTEYRCVFCKRSVFGPEQIDPKLGPPAHSECYLKQRLAEREKEIAALRDQLGRAEKS